MEALVEKAVYCPYCGERTAILVDCSVEQQEYIEDCEVCCRPITFQVWMSPEGELELTATHEND